MKQNRTADSTGKKSEPTDVLLDAIVSEPEDPRQVFTIGDIYKSALRNYEKLCPTRKALPTVAGIIGVSEKQLYRATINEAILDASEEGRLFVTTLYPQGYDLKKFLLFPQLTHQQPTTR